MVTATQARGARVLSAEQFYSRLGFFPHPGQRKVLSRPERFIVADCGRRWGKSLMGPHRKVLKMLLRKPTLGWIVAPTYDLGEKEFRVFWKILIDQMQVPIDKKNTYYSSRTKDFKLTTAWGSGVEVRSAEHPDSLVGEGLDWVIMAEAAKLKLSHWQKYIRPTLADKRGDGIFVSTPEGFNWFYDMWVLGQTGAEPDWWSIKSPTWENIVMFPEGRQDPEILEIERNNAPEIFAQEYGAEFTSFAGRIYSEFDEGYHVLSDYEYNPAWPNFLAFDFGHRNPTVCLHIQIDPSDNIYVWNEYFHRGLPAFEHARRLKSMIQWRVDGVYHDPSGAEEAGTFIKIWNDDSDYANRYLSGATWNPAPNDVPLGIGRVKQWLKLNPDYQGTTRPKLFVDRSCHNTIREFNTYRFREQSERVGENRDPKEEPRKKDDHAMDALRYFVAGHFGLDTHWGYQK